MKIRGSQPAYPDRVVLGIKQNQTRFAAVFILKELHCICFIKQENIQLNFSAWDFLGVNSWLRDFLGFRFCPL